MKPRITRPGPARRAGTSYRPGLDSLDPRTLLSGLATPLAAEFAPDHIVDRYASHAHRHNAGTPNSPAGVAPPVSSTPPGLASGHGRVISGITYTRDGSRTEQLDLYLPAGKAPAGGWPVILAFPGGGWRWASRKDYGQMVSVMNNYGYAVAGVDYTYASSGGGASWPANLDDARQAVRWVRDNANHYHFDPSKIVAMGDSSGAHLALLLGTYPDGPVSTDSPSAGSNGDSSTRVAAVVDFYGPADLTQLYGSTKLDAQPYLNTFLGGPPSQYPGRYAAASPVTYVNSSDPPMLIVQGLSDKTVPGSQSLELDAALTKAGVRHQLITISWADHGFGLTNLGPYNFVPDIASFLDGALNNGPIPASVSL